MAFQDPDKIADALSLIWDEKDKWNRISLRMNSNLTADDTRIKLKNIVMRRNQIVHQGDCLSTQIPLQQQIITKADTVDMIEFIKDVAYAIDKCIC